MKFRTLALLSLLFIGGGASAANISYDVDLTIGSGTVVGAITTNGTLGELSRSDFESWSLTLTDAAIIGMPQTLTQTNSVLAFFGPSGAALTASPDMQASQSAISWNFGSKDGDTFAFQFGGQQSGNAGLCGANAGSITCDTEPADPALTIGDVNNSPNTDYVKENGVAILATVAAPEMDPTSAAGAMTLLIASLTVIRARKRDRKGSIFPTV
jgi:hypothetical protein